MGELFEMINSYKSQTLYMKMNEISSAMRNGTIFATAVILLTEILWDKLTCLIFKKLITSPTVKIISGAHRKVLMATIFSGATMDLSTKIA